MAPNPDQALRQRVLELRAQGIVSVHLSYSGSGDSGDINSVEGYRADGGSIQLPCAWNDPLNAFLDSLTPGGYENNEGGEGTVVYDLTTGEWENDHTQFYTESHNSSHHGLIRFIGQPGDPDDDPAMIVSQ